MVRTKDDFQGKQFGYWTVLERAEDQIRSNGTHIAMWHCKCKCGTERDICGSELKAGKTKSCGCYRAEFAKNINKKENVYDETGEFAIGYTDKGEPYWVDKEDVPMLKHLHWNYDSNGYLQAANTVDNPLGIDKKFILLHVLVMGGYDSDIQANGLKVDHKTHLPRNEHKIDNRKSNLRIVSHANNSKNRSLNKNSSSGVAGVTFNQKSGKWTARIQVDGNRIFLGYFVRKEDAVDARKEAEIKYFGEYRYDAYN